MNEIALLKVRLQSLLQTQISSTPKNNTQPISQNLASHFNGIRTSIIELYPALETHLPKEISLTTPFGDYAHYDIPSANYIDLRCFTEETIAVLTLFESEH